MGKADQLEWIGSTIDDRYAIEHVVGEGGQGVVYRGRHLGFDEPIAIKFLKLPSRLGPGQRDDLLASFRAEARLLHRLSRKTAGIVQALDIGAATSPSGSWSPYIVMEWLEGESLEQHIERRGASGSGPLPLADAVRLLAPAISALSIAHKSGICHLDVKPGNLLLHRDGDETVMKVLDFGIAKVLEGTPALTQLRESGAGTRLFTPAYAAPEQFNRRFGPRGPWTDVFALALILVELATGKSPLGDGDAHQMYVAAADEAQRPSLRAAGIEVSDAAHAALTRALAVDSESRPRDAAELSRALQEALGAVASTTAPPPHRTTVGVSMWPELPESDEQRVSSAAPTLPADAATRVRGENRVCTVMVASLSGLDELRQVLEPEQVTDVINHCFAFSSDCIESLGGAVDRHIGDSLMAVFGMARASDNDAERAVHAALDMQRLLASFALPHRALRRLRLGATIGIATGRLFVRPNKRDTAPGWQGQLASTQNVTGEPVNAAARLQAAAPPGEILIERDTHRLVAGLFDAERVAAVGNAPNCYVVRRVAPPRVALAIEEFHGVKPKLVGRTAELATLSELFETVVEESTTCIATLVGNAGLGRSHLLSELAERIGPRAVAWVGHGSSLASNNSYGTLAGVLRAAFHIHEDDPDTVTESKLRRGIRELRRGRSLELYPSANRTTTARQTGQVDTTEMVTLLSRVLGPRQATGKADSMLPDDAGGRLKQRIAAAVATLIRSVGGPVVLYADDMQWIDDATLDLIDELGVRASDVPLLIVGTARPMLYERRPLWGEGKDAHVRIDVGPLKRRHLEQLARDRLARVDTLSDDVIRRLTNRAEGSPLTLVEMIHLLIDTGAIEVRADGPWHVHEDRLGDLALPTTVQGIVQARIDQLADSEREPLMRAAVVGRTFWDGVLRELGAGNVEAIPAALAALRAKRFIHARDTSMFPDEQEYVFAESATQHVAYESLSVKVRWRMHKLVAGWLEDRTGEATASLRAHHHELAGDVGRAAVAYLRAGAHAARLGQNAEALHNYERAAKIDEDTLGPPSSRDHKATSPITLDHDEDARVLSSRDRVGLRLGLGDVLRRVGRLDEAERCYHQARQRIIERERRSGEQLDAGEIAFLEAQIDYRLALLKQLHGSLDEAQTLVEGAIERGGAAADTAAMWALLAALLSRQNRLDECLQACIRGLRVCRSSSERDDSWRAAVSELLVTIGVVFYRRQQWIRAERCFLQAARVVDERSDPYQASRALNNVAATRYGKGDIEGAKKVWRRVLELLERAGDLAMTMTVLSNLAETEHGLKNHESARDYAQHAVRLGEQLHAHADLPDIYRNLAEAACALGAFDDAVSAASRALASAQQDAGRVYLASVALTAARVCAASQSAGQPPTTLAADLADALDRRFDTPGLAATAAECRTIFKG